VTCAQGDADQDREPSDPADGADADLRRFLDRLNREERMLVVLKRELYDGAWDDMEADLRARLEGRPHIFKLSARITEDLHRIEALRAFEQAHGVDLCDYVQIEP